MRMSSICSLYFFYYSLKDGLAYLLFSSNPVAANILSIAVNCVFLVVVLIFFLQKIKYHPSLLNWGFALHYTRFFNFLIVLVFWQGVSIVWSPAPLEVTLGYYLFNFAQFFSIFIFLAFSNSENIYIQAIRGYSLGSVFLIATLLVNSEFVDGRLGSAEFLHPNSIGHLSAISLIMIIGFKYFGKKNIYPSLLQMLVVFLLFLGLILSFSKSSIAAFFIAFSLATLISKSISNGKKVYLVFIIFLSSLIALFFLIDNINDYVNYSSGGDALSTYSGRTFIWEEVIHLISEKPLFGYGFMSFREVVPQIISVRLVHAHNEFLNIFFLYGLFGLVFFITFLFKIAAHSYNNREDVFCLLILMLVFYSLIKGAFEASTKTILIPIPLALCLLRHSLRKNLNYINRYENYKYT